MCCFLVVVGFFFVTLKWRNILQCFLQVFLSSYQLMINVRFLELFPDTQSDKGLKVHSLIVILCSIRLGVFLRRYPIARIFVILYMVSIVRQKIVR